MKAVLAVLLLNAVCLLTSCSDALVRAKPYEREYFAQEKMLYDPVPASSEFQEHIYSVREGSQGGAITFQGGCGCR